MVLGEMVPKNIAIAKPPTTAAIIAVPLHLRAAPFIALMNSTANFWCAPCSGDAEGRGRLDVHLGAGQDFVAESGRQGL